MIFNENDVIFDFYEICVRKYISKEKVNQCCLTIEKLEAQLKEKENEINSLLDQASRMH